MNEEERLRWRAVRDAADDNALARHTGADHRPAEHRLLAVLVADPTRETGLNGLVTIHALRAQQAAQDAEWHAAHQAAAEAYRAERVRVEAALRATIAGIDSSVGPGGGPAVVLIALCTVLGGKDGPDDPSLERGLQALERAGAWQGVDLVARALLEAARRETARWLPYFQRGLFTHAEVPDNRARPLRAMWRADATPQTRSEITALLEQDALEAIAADRFDDLCAAQQLQHHVTGGEFAPWVQDQADRMYADRLAATLPSRER